MKEESIDLRGLLTLAADSSTQSRRTLVGVVADLFADRAEALTDRERSLMTEILGQLIADFERDIRRDLAARFADNPRVPADLLIMLANDDITVAEPILLRSSVLRDEELIAVIHHRTVQHQIMIARRRHVSRVVSAALVETGNEDVVRALLENADAEISEATMEFLVEESQRLNSYQEPLLNRNELPPDLARRMYWWVSAALRDHLVRQFDIDPAALDESMEEVVAARTAGTVAPTADPGSRLAGRLARAGLADAELLLRALRQGQVALFEKLLGRLAALPDARIRAAMLDPTGRTLGIIFRAVGVAKETFAAVFLLCRLDGESRVRDPRDLARIMKFYDSIDQTDALKVVGLWRRSPDYLNAIERLGA